MQIRSRFLSRNLGAALVSCLAGALAGCAAPLPSDAPDDEVSAADAPASHVHVMAMTTSPTVRSGSSPHLAYFGGKVIQTPSVVQVQYGAGTYLPELTSAAPPNLANTYAQMLGSGVLDWLHEYNTISQVIGRGTFAGVVQIAPAAAHNGATITDASIQSELAAQITAHALPPATDNTLYMVSFPAGKAITEGGATSCVQFCAYHGTFKMGAQNVYYGVLPDLTGACSTGCGGGSAFQNQQTVASHEMVEAITDPEVGLASGIAAPLAWYDHANGEIGDICNAQQDNFVGTDGFTYRIQKEFSNQDSACITTRPSNLDEDPRLAAVSWGVNRLDTFARGPEGALYHKRWDGVGWAPSNAGWESLGGSGTLGTPEVVSWGANRLDVFVRDSALNIAHKWWDGVGWGPSNTGFEPLGAPPDVAFTSHPSVATWGVNRLDVFAVGSDHTLYHKAFNGAGWSPSNTGWEALGGGMLGPIKAVSWGINRLDVFAVGTDHALYHKWFTPAGWAPSSTSWESLGGNVNGAPDVVSWAANRLDVFVRNASGGLDHKAFDGVGWTPSNTGFENLGGSLSAPPRVVSWGVNRLDVFVRQADGALRHKWFNGAGWSPSNTGFEDLGGYEVGAPSVVTWGVNRLDAFTLGGDFAEHHRGFTAAGWAPFESLGVPH